jgi:hypothetical protein
MTDETNEPDAQAKPPEAAKPNDAPTGDQAEGAGNAQPAAATKPKAKRARKAKPPEAAKPNAKGPLKGVVPGEKPPLNVLHTMAVETSRALAKENNGNARQRAARRRRAKAV